MLIKSLEINFYLCKEVGMIFLLLKFFFVTLYLKISTCFSFKIISQFCFLIFFFFFKLKVFCDILLVSLYKIVNLYLVF